MPATWPLFGHPTCYGKLAAHQPAPQLPPTGWALSLPLPLPHPRNPPSFCSLVHFAYFLSVGCQYASPCSQHRGHSSEQEPVLWAHILMREMTVNHYKKNTERCLMVMSGKEKGYKVGKGDLQGHGI